MHCFDRYEQHTQRPASSFSSANCFRVRRQDGSVLGHINNGACAQQPVSNGASGSASGGSISRGLDNNGPLSRSVSTASFLGFMGPLSAGSGRIVVYGTVAHIGVHQAPGHGIYGSVETRVRLARDSAPANSRLSTPLAGPEVQYGWAT